MWSSFGKKDTEALSRTEADSLISKAILSEKEKRKGKKVDKMVLDEIYSSMVKDVDGPITDLQ